MNIDTDKIAALLAATETGEEAEALMRKLATKHGLEIEDDILITDPSLYADDGNAECEYDPAEYTPQEAAEDYVASGEWGDGGGSISVRVYRKGLDACGDESRTDGEVYEIDIEEDHAQKIRDAANGAEICGEDPDDHDWTGEGEGGLSENPGVWGHGGTAISISEHCRCCGLHRSELNRGSQRNPGEAESETTYRMLDAEEIAAHRRNGDMDEAEED
jgi:hypothetical protein